MTDLRATNAPLFTEFLDPVDMIGCFKADASLESINTSLDGHGLRFPMVLDPGRSLSEHVAISEYAPASARFGPYVDNVLGMNWELPTGRVVRIGRARREVDHWL
jgi:FAD/FMN-containing dehydrogenase